jgi:hypothetical protein
MNHRRRRGHAERAWYVASFVYSLVKIWLAQAFLADYDLNIVAFAVVEFVSVGPYAVGCAKLIGALVDRRRRRAIAWALVATAGFIAPDLFAVLTTRTFPTWLYVMIGLWVVLAAAAALVQARRTLFARRAAVALAALGLADDDVDDDPDD